MLKGVLDDLVFCLHPRCPVCRKGALYKKMSVSVVDICAECGADLGKHDIGDGAAVFILFLLCFALVPLAWVVELAFAPPLWLHGVLWTAVGLAAVFALLPTTKAYIILLEYRHRR